MLLASFTFSLPTFFVASATKTINSTSTERRARRFVQPAQNYKRKQICLHALTFEDRIEFWSARWRRKKNIKRSCFIATRNINSGWTFTEIHLNVNHVVERDHVWRNLFDKFSIKYKTFHMFTRTWCVFNDDGNKNRMIFLLFVWTTSSWSCLSAYVIYISNNIQPPTPIATRTDEFNNKLIISELIAFVVKMRFQRW